jgi:DNA-binding PadR family transcriptional regulator
MAKERKLSTLEATVLGLAWLRGPCTIYSIMKELSLSASSFHKSRAGTAYSVAKRLVEFGLLRVVSNPEGAVEISPEGIDELKKWVAPPVPMSDIAHSADFVRLRFFFLGVLDQQSRIEFIDTTIAGLRQFLSQCEALIPENEALGDYFGALATVSSILEVRARIEWLTLVRDWVENPMADSASWSEVILKQLKA